MERRDEILLGDNLEILPRGFQDDAIQMIYIDPPFNTGKQQIRKTLETTPDRRAATGSASKVRRYSRRGSLRSRRTLDRIDDYLAFLEPRLEHARRLLPRRAARSISISTTARRTTASCCSTRSSVARPS